jgi:hypothetical protein
MALTTGLAGSGLRSDDGQAGSNPKVRLADQPGVEPLFYTVP